MMELLERESYLVMLDAALVEAKEEGGRNALVCGEAGIGKSSLIGEFTSRHHQKIPVLWGACDPLFTPRPLGPLHDMAPQIGGKLTETVILETPRSSLFSATLSEFQRRFMIVVFEDVHWADEATLDLLRYLGRRINQTSVLLIISYREDELGTRHPLRQVLGDLTTSVLTRRISLPPLSEDAVHTLAGSQEIDAAALHRQTGGNPFFVTEVLANPRKGIPPSIRDAVMARVARLSASGLAVLEASAIAGQRIESWLLAALTGAEASAVEESLSAGVLLTQGDTLVFRHELARRAILESISPLRRQVLHRLALDALKSSPAARRDLSRLVHHARGASDTEAILAYAPLAAREAAEAGTHRAAADLYELTLTYSDELSVEERGHLLEAYAKESAFVNHFEAVIQARRQAIELWQTAGNHYKEGENLVFLALALNGAGKWVESAAAGETAIEILENLPPGRELAMAYRLRALTHLTHHNFTQALPVAQKAAAIAEPLGDPLTLAMIYDTLGSSLMYQDYEGGQLVFQNGLKIAIDAGLDGRAASIYANYGSILCDMYHFKEAAEILAEGLIFTAERDLDMLSLYMMGYQALTYLHLGRWSEAEDTAVKALQASAISPQSRFTPLRVLVALQSRRGQKVDHMLLDTIRQITNRANIFDFILPEKTTMSEAALLAGDKQTARTEAQAGYDLAVEKKHPWHAGRCAYLLWRTGAEVVVPDWVTSPFVLQISGRWQAAAAEWEKRDCPYEMASALMDGDHSAKLKALEIFDRLGARSAAAALRFVLRAEGYTNLPQQPHPSTRQNPFALTNRQLDVLSLLIEGLTNAEIAARLHISPKTVDHHVSAVLSKMDVSSREEAAASALKHPAFQKK